jgi:hypothetical protein
MHFGIFKAGTYRPYMVEFDASMLSFPLEMGHSPSRWCRCINAMLLKKIGLLWVTKLQTIILLEADGNLLNKITRRMMMAEAEALGLLAPEQYGSRKLHDAIHVATNKYLTFDITHQKKAPAALASNDAVSCYDLIMHTAASLAMQGRGVLEPVVMCMFTTIEKMEHIIWTIFGDSTVSYGGELWIVPPQGVLQRKQSKSFNLDGG